MIFFAIVRRSPRIRDWVEQGRAGAIARTFIAARPLDYAAVLAIKAPTFLASAVAHYFALSIYGVSIPVLRLILFLPLVFLAGALPISVAHLGTSQAAWLLFFAGSASPAKLVAYSLVAQFTYMFCNAVIGLFFVPRASRELTAIRQSDPEESRPSRCGAENSLRGFRASQATLRSRRNRVENPLRLFHRDFVGKQESGGSVVELYEVHVAVQVVHLAQD